MMMKLQSQITTGIACGCLFAFAFGCKGESSVTEYNDDADVVASFNGNSVSDILISAGLVIDSNEFRHTSRKAWFAKYSIGVDKLSSREDSVPVQGCKLTVQHQQVPKVLALGDGVAYPMPQGKVIYCKKGKISWALQDGGLKTAVDGLGLDPEEIDQIDFYRIPLEGPNSFSSVTPDGFGSVVIYEGLLDAFNSNSLDADSALRGVLLHEVGVIHQLRKDNQRHIQTTNEKARITCLQKFGIENLSENEKIDQCRKSIAANTKATIYSADEFAVKVLARKMYGTSFRPTEFSKYIRLTTSAGRDPYDPHPDSIERAIKFENGLKNAGIDLKTGGLLIDSTK